MADLASRAVGLWILAVGLGGSPLVNAAGGAMPSTAPYVAAGRTCAGLPKLAVTTAPGLCIGIVFAQLDFPREVLPLSRDDLLVTEMRRWVPKVGRLVRLRRGSNGWTRTVLFEHLDRPHGLVLGPDGKIYVGEVGKVFRFSLDHPAREYVIKDLPGDGLHPLTQLAFDGDSLLVTVGSPSNNCESEAGHASCQEADTHGLIRRYVFTASGPRFTVFSRGLRNTMALAIHASGTVLGIDNGRDALVIHGDYADEALHPADTLNVLVTGADYGWPYCYEHEMHAPEFPSHDCSHYTLPTILLPAHAAPLGMAYWYQGSPAWKGSLVIAYHGYRPNGHRLVDFAVDDRGIPDSGPRALTGPWAFSGSRLGSPVDVREAPTGELFLTDDRNGLVLEMVADSTGPTTN